MSRGFGARRAVGICGRGVLVEPLETRVLLSTSTINAGTAVRAVATQLQGINTATWDGLLGSSTTLSMAQSAGLSAVRLPGGSTSDTWHFATSPSSQGYGQTLGQMAKFAANLSAPAIVTIDYGSGSPQEAVAEWAYLDGSPSDTTPIGTGPEYNASTNTWGAAINWQTVGYWASLRQASPLATDDGLNFLRLGPGSSVNHPQAFNIQDWEVGNEEYGTSWETDGHGATGDTLSVPGGKSKAHDPTTYVAFANQFATEVRSIIAGEGAPPILIGVDADGPDNEFNNWMPSVLKQCKTQGFVPDFLSDHVYDQSPGQENDATLLGDPTTPTTATASLDWAQRAGQYASLISSTLGSAGANIQLWATEINSVSSDPGKQSTSLVNGLFIADSLGALMETPYNGAWVWDLHNGTPGTENNSASLYGWRAYGDYGMILNGSGGPANQPTPNYFAEQLFSKIDQSGGTVVSASSDSSLLDTFAVLEPSGDLDLLVINKNPPSAAPPNNLPDPSVNETFKVSGFAPSGAATVYQYGVAQDDGAAGSGGNSSLSQTSANFSVSGNSFSYAVPNYSMTVIDLKPAPALPAYITASAGAVYAWAPASGALTLTSGTLTFTADSATDTVDLPVNLTVNGAGASVVFDTTQHLAGLTLENGAKASVVASGSAQTQSGHDVLVIGTLSGATATLAIDSSSTLDLTDNDLIVHSGTLSSVDALLASGYAGGQWSGAGISSSLAAANGRALGDLLNGGSGKTATYTSFDGQNVASTDVLVKYTRYGDANLDGVVNFADLLTVAQHYGQAGTDWATGDFNFDGLTNFSDLLLLGQNYGQ